MFKILICEAVLHDTPNTIFAAYSVDIAVNADEFLNFTYEKIYDLYLVNFFYYNTINELKKSGDKTKTIFIDEFYNINHLKSAFIIGDEYLIKPLYFEELKIRVGYHHKKCFGNSKNIIIYKNFFYHASTRQLFSGTKKVKLSPRELKLLELFLTHLNKPLSKEILFDELESHSDGSLRVYISKLNKLGFEICYERATFSYTLNLAAHSVS